MMKQFLQQAFSKSIIYLELILFALILILLPIQFPSLLTETHIQYHHWFQGPRVTYYDMAVSAYLSDILIVVFSLWTMHKWKGIFTNISSLFLLIFLLIASTTLWYAIPLLGGACYKLFAICLLFCLFHLVHHILSNDGERKLRFLLLVILMMMVFEAAVATTQYFTQALVGLKRLEPYALSISEFPMPAGQLWSIDAILLIKRSFAAISRPYGTLTHANTLGGFLFFCSPIAFYFAYYVRKIYLEVFFALLIFFNFFALSLTFSRAAIFAYLLMTSLWFLIFFTRIERTEADTKKLKRLATYTAATIFICFLLFYSQYTERGGVFSYNNFVQVSSDAPRIKSGNTACAMILNHLFWGVGLENYPNYIIDTIMREGWVFDGQNTVVHNIYLLITAETGIFGGLFFLLFIGSILWKAARNLNPLTVTITTTFIGLILLGLVDFYLWRHPGGRLMLFTTAAFLSAMCPKRVKIPSLTPAHS